MRKMLAYALLVAAQRCALLAVEILEPLIDGKFDPEASVLLDKAETITEVW